MKENYVLERDRELLEKFFDDGAECIEEYPEHWITGGDGESYCYECAVKEVEKLSKENPDECYSVDGGGGYCDGDSQAYCEECGKLLENDFTLYACQTAIDNFIECGFKIDSDDCLAMSKVISAVGWEPPRKNQNLELYDKLHRLCQKILGKYYKGN